MATVGTVHVYHNPFPCQGFTGMGLGKGCGDTRSQPLRTCLEYIDKWRPDVAMLENVYGLWTRHKLRYHVMQIVHAIHVFTFTLEPTSRRHLAMILNQSNLSGLDHWVTDPKQDSPCGLLRPHGARARGSELHTAMPLRRVFVSVHALRDHGGR